MARWHTRLPILLGVGVHEDLAVEVEAVSYRVTLTQLTWLWLWLALTYGAVALIIWLQSPDDSWSDTSYPLLTGALVGLPLASITRLQMSVTLTPDALIHRRLRRRQIPWTNISQISTQSLMGGRSVVVYEHSGRRTRLGVPVTGLMYWDRDFDAKFHAIGEWFMAHRGSE